MKAHRSFFKRVACRTGGSASLVLFIVPLAAGCSLAELEAVTEQLAGEVYDQVVRVDAYSVAVSDFVTEGEVSELGRDASNFLVGHLTRMAGPQVKIYDRAFLTQQLHEHAFQWANYAKEWHEITPYGDKAPASVIIAGTIHQYSTYFDLRARAIDLRSGEVLMAASRQFIRSKTNDEKFERRTPVPGPEDNQPAFPDEPVRHTIGRAADRLTRELIEDLKKYPELRLATTPLKGPDTQAETEYGRVVLQSIETNLARYGTEMKLQLLNRRNLKDVLGQQATEQSAFFDQDNVQPIDRGEGADAFLVGEITLVARGCNVHIEVVESTTKKTLASANVLIPPGKGQEEMFRPVP